MGKRAKSVDKIVGETETPERPDDFADDAHENMNAAVEAAERPTRRISLKKAGKDDYAILETVLTKTFTDLAEHKVKVGLMFADAGVVLEGGEDKPLPALKVKGRPVQGMTKIKSTRDRVMGSHDAVIQIDAGAWRTMSAVERKSLIDRQLRHLSITTDDEGNLKKDDAGRPKLSYRQPDIFLEGFAENVKMYGEESVDLKAHKAFMDKHGQLFMEYMKGD